MRSAVELAKDWRTDRILRRLEAMLIVADSGTTLILTGAGDVIEPELGLAAIGSGGSYAHSAARALLENTSLTPLEIVKKSLAIAVRLQPKEHTLTESEIDAVAQKIVSAVAKAAGGVLRS